MPTELRDAWPNHEYNEKESCPGTKAITSARQAEAPEHDMKDIYALLDDIKREQTQRMTILTAIMVVMMLSFMSQVDTLKKHVHLLVAAQRRTF